MLVVTQQQLALIGNLRWEDEMLEELRRFAPRLYEIRSREAFLRLIHQGRARAEDYGFTTRGPVRLFLQTMVSLGHRFDEDPQLPSIRPAIGNPRGPQKTRAQDLFAAITQTFESVLGPRSEHAVAALARLRDSGVWSASVPSSPEQLVEQMLADMHQIFPRKADAVGDPTLERLIETAMERAESHQLHPLAGGRIIAALMFALGWGITTDPMYPWVAELLERRETGPGYDRAEHLAAKARIYLGATLEHLAGGH